MVYLWHSGDAELTGLLYLCIRYVIDSGCWKLCLALLSYVLWTLFCS